MSNLKIEDKLLPTLAQPVSQLVTENQFNEPVYDEWLDEIREAKRMHRKQWEFIYILRSLDSHGQLRTGQKGIGFGVGSEPLPAAMAKRGCKVVATEINIQKRHEKGWVRNQTVESQLAKLNERDICPPDQFRENVSYRDVDMNDIPADLRRGEFDFVWSCCALEHLGTMEKCTEFIFKSLECLKPGGVASHTTEYNTFGFWTVRHGSTVFFRRKEIVDIARRLTESGHHIELNLNKGRTRLDRHYDWPPYKQDNHLKLMVSKQWKFIGATSIGLTIRKK